MATWVTVLGCALGIAAFVSDSEKVPLGEVAESAVQQSKLTLRGSKPFHLKADIIETTNPSSEYQAKVEEYWVSPEKWRRTIEAPGFSQTLIVNGDQVSEKDTGDYFPWWLNDLLTAMMDPLPMIEQLKQVNSQIVKPQDSNRPNTCAEFHSQIDRWIFCFEGRHGLLTSVFFRGYDAEFGDFKSFADKRVARLILTDPEPGTTIQARVTELAELHQIDESLFAVLQATPERERIRSVKVEESTVRGLALSSTEISWPAVGGGPATGKCAVYISADRAGHIREVWPKGCDNAGLQDPLRDIVKKWQLKPAADHGAAVQIEALVTFTFDAKVVNDGLPPKSSDAEVEPHTQVKEPLVVQPRVTKMVKPDCSRGHSCHGKHGEVFVVVDVSADGKAGDISVRSGDPQLFDDAIKAARQCRFEPGILLGKPTRMTYVLKYRF